MSRDPSPSELGDLREPGTGASPRIPDRGTTQYPRQGLEVPHDPQPSREPDSTDPRVSESRTAYYERDRAYRLRDSEIRTLGELGKFRVVAAQDLARHAYRKQRREFDEDIRNLARQGLVRQKTFAGRDANPRELLTLTKTGYRLLRAKPISSRRANRLPRLRQTQGSKPRCRHLPALPKRSRKDCRQKWQESPRHPRLRTEEKAQPRLRQVWRGITSGDRRASRTASRAQQDPRARPSRRVRNAKWRDGPRRSRVGHRTLSRSPSRR